MERPIQPPDTNRDSDYVESLSSLAPRSRTERQVSSNSRRVEQQESKGLNAENAVFSTLRSDLLTSRLLSAVTQSLHDFLDHLHRIAALACRCHMRF